MELINILNDLNISTNVQYKKLSDLEMKKKYKIYNTNVKYSEKYEKHILYLTVELNSEKCEIPVPDKYYSPFQKNSGLDHKELVDKFVKASSHIFTPKDCTTSKVYYSLEFST